ncbi:MAG: pyridoxal phosphate-dependent aminotransferase [Granulosicoccaceae bacterium]
MHVINNFGRIGDENAFAVMARANALAATGKSVINLGIGQPDFPTPENIVEAAVKALRDGKHGYTATEGIPELREAVASSLSQRYNTLVDSNNVMIMPGGKVTMYAAISLFGQTGVDILYPDPGFPIYKSMIDFTGANAIAMPIRESNAFGFSADEALSLLTDKTRLVILNSPANPTGGVTPKHEIDKLVAGLAARPDIAILSDEIYDQLSYDDHQHTSLLEYPEIRDQLILLNGWSKTYAMTGWRLGYSIWPDALFESVRKLAVNSWSCVNTSAQHAALEAITGPQAAVHNMVATFDQRRNATVTALNKLPGVSCISPKGAFYAFPNITNTGWQAKKMASALLEETGVATIGGPDFGELGEGYLRISYANSTTNILEAMNRIHAFLESRASGG